MTQTEYASARGWVKSYVSKLKTKGMLVMSGNLVDAAASDARIAQYRDPARGGDRTASPDKTQARDGASATVAPAPIPAAPGGDIVANPASAGAGMTYQEAARRERIAKARMAELELAEEAGDLLRRDVVQAVWFTLTRQAQQSLRTLKYRIGNQLALESDPRKVCALLDAEITLIIAELKTADPCKDVSEDDAT